VSADESRNARTLEVVERVAVVLDELGIESALIGASALAVHGYPRATQDVDLGTATDPFTMLKRARDRLRSELGAGVDLVTPDADDPLGGVLTISGDDFDPVQVVNFLNPLAAGQNPGAEAIRMAIPDLIEGSRLRVVTLPHLVALKLYSGGYKSRLDVLELLERNPDAPLDQVREVCVRYGLGDGLDRILEERGR
jgi:hypothetical protein